MPLIGLTPSRSLTCLSSTVHLNQYQCPPSTPNPSVQALSAIVCDIAMTGATPGPCTCVRWPNIAGATPAPRLPCTSRSHAQLDRTLNTRDEREGMSERVWLGLNWREGLGRIRVPRANNFLHAPAAVDAPVAAPSLNPCPSLIRGPYRRLWVAKALVVPWGADDDEGLTPHLPFVCTPSFCRLQSGHALPSFAFFCLRAHLY